MLAKTGFQVNDHSFQCIELLAQGMWVALGDGKAQRCSAEGCHQVSVLLRLWGLLGATSKRHIQHQADQDRLPMKEGPVATWWREIFGLMGCVLGIVLLPYHGDSGVRK